MSTKYTKTKRSLFSFSDLIENTVAPAPPKKERSQLYIKTLGEVSTGLNVEAAENTVALKIEGTAAAGNPTEAIFDKNEIIYDDLKLPEDGQLSQPKQPPEGSYDSIWKKPKIRPNVDFEEDMGPDEESYFDEEELVCSIETPVDPLPFVTKKINMLGSNSYKNTIPKTQPSSAQEESQEEPPIAVQEKSVENTPGVHNEYIEVVDDVHDATCEIKKKQLLGKKVENTAVWDTSLSLEKSNRIINDLYCTKE